MANKRQHWIQGAFLSGQPSSYRNPSGNQGQRKLLNYLLESLITKCSSMLCENARLWISGGNNLFLFYLSQYFRKGKGERDVLTLCATCPP